MATTIQRAWRSFVNDSEVYTNMYKCQKCNSIDLYEPTEYCCGQLRVLYQLMGKNAEYRFERHADAVPASITIQRAWRDFAKSALSKHHCSICGDHSKGVMDSLDPYCDIDWYCQSCWDKYATKHYYCPFCCDSKHTVVSTYREMCQECCQECS